MHAIPPYVPRVYLIDAAGHRTVFKNLQALAKRFTVREIRELIGDGVFGESALVRGEDGRWVVETVPLYRYIVRDDQGEVIAPQQIVNARREWLSQVVVRRRQKKRRMHRWLGLRHVRTQAEHRLNQRVALEEPTARGARRSKQLPTAWDDIPRRGQRNWKQYRRTQWRE